MEKEQSDKLRKELVETRENYDTKIGVERNTNDGAAKKLRSKNAATHKKLTTTLATMKD